MEIHFAAEVSSNHNRSLERCFEFIDRAAAIGCESVKFQLFRIDDLFIPQLVREREELQKRKKWELPVSFLPHLKDRCEEKKLLFGCTPFYLKAVEELYPYVDYYKIASYELLWQDMLRECAKTSKPVILSTGMADLSEVEAAANLLLNSGCTDLTLLHCSSSYPAPLHACNLAAIETMRNKLQLPVGWSDHTVNPAVIYRAVHHWSAAMVEFHLDLEGEGEEYGTGHCWMPGQIEEVISNVRKAYAADGGPEKKPSAAEKKERLWRADPSDGLRPLISLRRKEGWI